MTFKILNADGDVVRTGICKDEDLAAQARDGEHIEVVPEEQVVATAELPALAPPAAAPVPIAAPVRLEMITVLLRALQNAGVALDMDTARAELTAEVTEARTAQHARMQRS